jgi:DDE superfamily endonuclease
MRAAVWSRFVIVEDPPDETAAGLSVHDRDRFFERLTAFRFGLYECFDAWPDTLFELVDALTGAARPVRSLAELMFEPRLRRGWGSVYQAMQHGRIDVDLFRRLLVGQTCADAGAGPLVFAMDTTCYPRPDTRLVDDVGMQYTPGRTVNGSPAVPGWSMQLLVRVAEDGLEQPVRSWTMPMDMRRVPADGNANEIAAEQLRELAARLQAFGGTDVPVLVLFDAGYCPIYLTQHRPDRVQLLVRLRTDRVFYGRPEPRQPSQPGRARKHGRRFKLNDLTSWGTPALDTTATGGDNARVRLRVWHGFHPEPRQRRKWQGTDIVEGSLILRERSTPDGVTQVCWLWWAGPDDVFDPRVLAGAYPHRFSIEHTIRFLKQDLGWTKYTPLSTEQAERWTWLVLAAYSQLHLSRPFAVDHRLPWEKPVPPGQLSPRRVARVFRHTAAQLTTPASAPKPSRPGRGRPIGAKNKTQRSRKPVIKKGRPANTGHPQGQSPLAKASRP